MGPRPKKDERVGKAPSRRPSHPKARSKDKGYSLAGPRVQASKYDPHNTYFEEGYRQQNPWMDDEDGDDDDPSFSLARTFPRTVRWKKHKDGSDEEERVQPHQKGEEEPPPMTEAARKNAQSPSSESNSSTMVDTSEDNMPSTPDEEPKNESNLDAEPATRKRQEKHHRIEAFRPNNASLSKIAKSTSAGSKDHFNTWSAIRQKLQRPFAEFIGTVILIFLGCSANLASVTSNSEALTMPAANMAWGLAVMIGIYVSGGGSGGFLNPALTIMLSFYRGFPSRRIPSYILAQILGAFVGGLLAFGVYKDSIMAMDHGLKPESTGTSLYTQPRDIIEPATAFFSEFLGTAIIGCTILALGDSGNSPPGAGMHAFIIGLVVVATCLSLSWNTRGCFNPVRDFGPRLAAITVGYPLSAWTDYHNWWIWGGWAAPISGAMVGGLTYDLFIFKGGESPVNYSFEHMKRKGLKEQSRWFRMTGRHERAHKVQQTMEDALDKMESQT